MKTLLIELFELLDKTEESDSGMVFHPNVISSCRVMDCQRINELLMELKNLIKA